MIMGRSVLPDTCLLFNYPGRGVITAINMSWYQILTEPLENFEAYWEFLKLFWSVLIFRVFQNIIIHDFRLFFPCSHFGRLWQYRLSCFQGRIQNWKEFCLEINILTTNYWILRIHVKKCLNLTFKVKNHWNQFLFS